MRRNLGAQFAEHPELSPGPVGVAGVEVTLREHGIPPDAFLEVAVEHVEGHGSRPQLVHLVDFVPPETQPGQSTEQVGLEGTMPDCREGTHAALVGPLPLADREVVVGQIREHEGAE